MSYGGYQQYGGNPYGETGQSGHSDSNPNGQGNQGGGYGTTNNQQMSAPPPLTHHEASDYSQYSTPAAPVPSQPSAPMSQQDFLARVDGTKARIAQLTSNISAIANIHQRLLSSPESGSAQLENLVTQTQILNTGIKDEIKFLERDAARGGETGFKTAQIATLKQSFKTQLHNYQQEEQQYERRYRDAIARQYRIVNPDATDEEVNEAANANWGDEGVFQTALKSNRSGQATSVLGTVRARHNDIVQIEKTLGELNLLFQQLNEAVVYQDSSVQQVEDQTHNVTKDTENVNVQLDKGIEHARRARRLKWWTLLTVVAIIAILALVLGLYFGLKKN